MAVSKSLKRIIYNEFLKSSMVPILAIELVLLMLFFGINHSVAGRNQEALLNEVTESLSEISGRQAEIINLKLEAISKLSVVMQQDHEQYFRLAQSQTAGSCVLPNGEPELLLHQNGALYKRNNQGSSLYLRADQQSKPGAWQKARCTEVMDSLLTSIVDTQPLIAQAYFNGWDSLSRLYPYITNVAEQYGAYLPIQDYNFYYLADAEHNPSREPVWTGAYLDPAGQGWMISNIVPIYQGDFLEGVSGLDVTIDELVTRILEQNLPWKSGTFMIDQTGVILAMDPAMESLLGLTELKQHTYAGSIQATIEKPDEFNILKSTDQKIQKQLADILSLTTDNYTLQTGSNRYLVARHTIPETGWFIITLVDEGALFEPIARLRDQINWIGYAAVVAMVVFYGLFFLYLRKKASRLSQVLAKPIEKLADATGQLGGSLTPVSLAHTGIHEIDALLGRFNTMSSDLMEKTQLLIEAKSKEQAQKAETAILERMATTDTLTGLSNRRQIKEMLVSEISRAGRSHRTFSLIILDIDFFKAVNDTYGHAVGDNVLVHISTLLQQSIRQADIIGRWGGEEFLLICPVTELDGAVTVAKHLCAKISETRFEPVGTLTASFGLTCYHTGDSPNDLIVRADRAMYQSKREGRNRVSVYHSSMSLN